MIKLTKGQYLSDIMNEIPSDCILSKRIPGCGATTLELNTRFQGELLKVEKFNPAKVYSAIYLDEEGYYYIKRFCFELSDNTVQYFVSPDENAKFVAISEDRFPTVNVEFVQSGKKAKEPLVIDVDEFIAVKGYKAKGKRAGMNIASIDFGEPMEKEIPEEVLEEVGENVSDELQDSGAEESQIVESSTTQVIDFDMDDELTLF